MPQALTARQAAAEKFSSALIEQPLVGHGVEATKLIDEGRHCYAFFAFFHSTRCSSRATRTAGPRALLPRGSMQMR